MKSTRVKQKEFTGKFDDVDRSARRSYPAKKSKRPLNEDDENEFQSWMNRPSDVSNYLEDKEDIN